MTLQKSLAIACIGGFTLAGCAGSQLETARKASPTGDSFTQNLYAGYIDLSAGEFDEADYVDSDWFAGRAISAAGNVAVAPEEIGNRALPADRARVLSAARERLVAALQATATSKHPVNAARAQVMFDCWMQEQEENFQPDHIAACRDGFIAAIGQVESAIKPMAAIKVAKPAPAPAPAAAAPPKPDPKSWIAYFDFDVAKITPAARPTIVEAATYSMHFDKARVTITGHTDRAGSTNYNENLAGLRADEVAMALMDQWVSANAIRIRVKGESDPAVATPDGKREPANRRVMINVESK